jgi:hypothetical protein
LSEARIIAQENDTRLRRRQGNGREGKGKERKESIHKDTPRKRIHAWEEMGLKAGWIHSMGVFFWEGIHMHGGLRYTPLHFTLLSIYKSVTLNTHTEDLI